METAGPWIVAVSDVEYGCPRLWHRQRFDGKDNGPPPEPWFSPRAIPSLFNSPTHHGRPLNLQQTSFTTESPFSYGAAMPPTCRRARALVAQDVYNTASHSNRPSLCPLIISTSSPFSRSIMTSRFSSTITLGSNCQCILARHLCGTGQA